MVGFAASLILGGAVLLRLPGPLDTGFLSTLVPVALFGVSLYRTRIPCGFVLGFWLASATVTSEMEDRLTTRIDQTITGIVTGLPGSTGQAERFYFKVTSGELTGRRFRLSWRGPPTTLVPGQVWQLPVRLRPPTGSVNFGLFDYEGWLFLNRIHGTGYVLSSGQPQLLGKSGPSIDQARFGFRDKLLSVVPPDSIGTFLALTVGDTSLLTPSEWQILNRTGTTHLLIVSGLHIGLVASLCFLALRTAGLGLPLIIGITIAVCGAYALLSGWGLPIQRAFIMTLVFLLCLYFSRFVVLPFQLGLAGLVVFLLDPLATLGNGFWLSFGAVSALLLALSGQAESRAGLNKWLWSSLRAQWVVYLALLPLLAYAGSQLPLGSLAVNLVAIPWVGMLLVPLLLVSSILLLVIPVMGEGLLGWCQQLVNALWWFLDAAAGLDLTLKVAQQSLTGCLVAVAGVAVLLTPAGLVPRWPGLLLLLVLLVPAPRVRTGDLRLTFLDVGQGLSVSD